MKIYGISNSYYNIHKNDIDKRSCDTKNVCEKTDRHEK